MRKKTNSHFALETNVDRGLSKLFINNDFLKICIN